eukprot:NODE_4866_length_547_cov_60.206827_g3566_i0.p1 GENE.NODE_4866_length_547_cov_60.206827_g3566_i0~~NODE_4866_length_547_cov_60.206827_g3566_i0.p1  ORF type:complete len:94 (+),score=16.61 NODE_4866_length_547_cov_60.206827_g3566_i0:114-395(+)
MASTWSLSSLGAVVGSGASTASWAFDKIDNHIQTTLGVDRLTASNLRSNVGHALIGVVSPKLAVLSQTVKSVLNGGQEPLALAGPPRARTDAM